MTYQDNLIYTPTYTGDTTIAHGIAGSLHDSVLRVLSLFTNILPGLVAFIVAFFLMAAVGVFLSFLLRKVLVSVKFDERIARGQASGISGIADWSPQHSPTALAGRIVFWGSVLLGLAVGIMALDASYASTTLSLSLLPYLSRAVGALLLLFAGNLIARFLARTVLIGAVNSQLQYARLLSGGVKWLVIVLTAAMVLVHLQIGSVIVELAFGIFFGGIVLVLALSVGLGSKDLVRRALERSLPLQHDSSIASSQPAEHTTLRHF